LKHAAQLTPAQKQPLQNVINSWPKRHARVMPLSRGALTLRATQFGPHRNRREQMSDTPETMMETLQNTVETAMETAQTAVEDAMEAVQDGAADLMGKASDMMDGDAENTAAEADVAADDAAEDDADLDDEAGEAEAEATA
jgi:hypothetical protein